MATIISDDNVLMFSANKITISAHYSKKNKQYWYRYNGKEVPVNVINRTILCCPFSEVKRSLLTFWKIMVPQRLEDWKIASGNNLKMKEYKP